MKRANYDTMQPNRNAARRLYKEITHVCCVCGWEFYSETRYDARKVQEAVITNKDGPYCILCLHVEMASRYASARGLTEIALSADRVASKLRAVGNRPKSSK